MAQLREEFFDERKSLNRRELLSRKEYEDLGESFEEKEHRLFGKEGFEKVVEEVAGLEKRLGIYELARFMPGQRG